MSNVRDQIISYAQTNVVFQTNALLQNLLELVDTSKQNILWHLYRLVEQGQLLRVGRGAYTIEVKPQFFPHPNAKVVRIYQLLKEQFPLLSLCVYRVFLSPDADFVADYIHLDQASLIVKPLVSEAPTQEIEGVSSPRLEKLLVDILCDKDFFYLQGQEAAYIFEKATQIYGIKTDQLMRYASRRNAKSKIEQLLAK